MPAYRQQDPELVVRRWDRVFDALSAEPRRQLVDALMDVPDDGWVQLPDAAVTPAIETSLETLHLELQHQHLPLLADGGYVEWERTPFSVTRGPRFDEVRIVLDGLYANATDIPVRLVAGCQTLEEKVEQTEF
ncbi:hypothetical protein [Natrarchaeobaculum sulfurireducens]|uniref:Transcriptional regulator, ArsR family n=1 Tax=Natrarchaeobaculum sulfurireducens TaxID=2044521 RepID=A0A346PVB1_9EURY|nr:hypothetical protein [Natrarchaeobaculum sulfurireducens]AXR79715.1 hypothetical protein AArc1_3422 [Natrarchaeobaculum sulfurireducens]AXR83456.1 hypothetical protein AArcMg_3482 [Natrarchaeobaculum sulfurireducens]